MDRRGPILSLASVRCAELLGSSIGSIDLVVEAGALVLIDARDTALASAFADLCCGLHAPDEGEIRFLQRDWSRQPAEMADALRGLIGRVMARPGWLPFLDAGSNALLQQLYHTRADVETLRADAAGLAVHFGMPGLPSGAIGDLSPGDLTRLGVVRAFIGEPKLVILESPVQGLHGDMVMPIINKLLELRDRGGAAIWLSRSRMVWDNPQFPADVRLRLNHQGLSAVRTAA